MKQRLILAAVFGVLLGVALGFSPITQPNYAAKPQFLTQANQPSVAKSSAHAAPGLLPVTVAILIGLAAGSCTFLMAKRRSI